MKSIYTLSVGTELTRTRRKPIRKGLLSLYFQEMHWQFLIMSILLMGIGTYLAALEYEVVSFRFILILMTLLILFRVAVVPLFQILKAYFPPFLRKFMTLFFTSIILCSIGFIGLNFDPTVKQKIESIFTHFKADGSGMQVREYKRKYSMKALTKKK